MSSAIDDYKFIVQKNDKLLAVQSKKTNTIIALVILILIITMFAYSYSIYVKVNQVNIYPYNYNTEQGDYDLNYLVEQNYINNLSSSDLTKYLSLTNPNKLIAIKQSLITSITS